MDKLLKFLRDWLHKQWPEFPFSRGSSQFRDWIPALQEFRSPALQADSLPSEPQKRFLYAFYMCACVCVCVFNCFSHIWLFATPCTVACQTPLSIGFSQKEHWSGLSFPPPGESSWPRDQTCVSCISCIAGWATVKVNLLRSPGR